MQRSAGPSPAFLSTTLSALDEALHGGVACGSLTEVTEPILSFITISTRRNV